MVKYAVMSGPWTCLDDRLFDTYEEAVAFCLESIALAEPFFTIQKRYYPDSKVD